MGSLISIEIELNGVKSFLERVYRSVDSEHGILISRAQAGEFKDPDEEANAFFSPRTSERLAMRAALNEINSLVEWELFSLGVVPFSKELLKKNKLRLVWDLKRDDLHRLVEGHYSIKLDKLPGSKTVEEIRKTINAFKHRKGYKDPRKENVLGRYELDREFVANCLVGARKFLRVLHSHCKPGQ
jgi:hypothetical protein